MYAYVILLLCVTAAVGHVFYDRYYGIREKSIARVDVLSEAITAETVQTIALADAATRIIASTIHAHSVSHSSEKHTYDAVHVTEIVNSHPGLSELGFIDAKGKMILGIPKIVEETFNDRPYFQHHTTNKSDQIKITWEEDCPVTHGKGLMISRRVNDHNDRFLGVAFVMLPSDELSNFDGYFRTGVDGIVTQLTSDGIVVSRSQGKEFIGQTIDLNEFASDLDEKGGEIVIKESPLDGIRRIYFAKKAHPYPIITIVALAEKDVFAGWVQDVLEVSIALIICAIAFTYIFVRFLIQYREVLAAKDAAEIANKTKSEILANTSHELRTPLNTIIGFAEIMKEGLFGPIGNDKYEQYCSHIHSSGTHLLSIINDILDLAKIEAGKMELYEEDIEVARLIQGVLNLISERANKANITLVVNDAAPARKIFADERKMKQILMNLLSNAIKFTKSGGVVTVTTSQDDQWYKITVEDTGVGMTDEDLKRVLKPFEQGSNPLVSKVEGTGLGIPITAGMVALHGGKMSIRSRPGVGTSATVMLPKTRF